VSRTLSYLVINSKQCFTNCAASHCNSMMWLMITDWPLLVRKLEYCC